MTEEKIGYHEALALLVILISAKIFLSMPRNMALIGKSAGWLIVLLSGILSLFGFYFINVLLKKFPGKNIIQIGTDLTGKWFGPVLGFLVFLFFLVSAALLLRQFAESFIIAILPRTPISVIITFFLILLIYCVILGIETLSRVAWFFGPYLLIALIVTITFSLNFNLEFLLPILGPGPLPLLKHSLDNTGLFSGILFLGLIAPLIRKKEKVSRVGFYSLSIAVIINTLVTAAVILTFNYASAGKLAFPIFQLSRLISISEFIQRVEAVFVFLWFFAAAIELSCLFYGTVASFSLIFKLKNYRPLVFPMAALIFTLSLIPASMTEAVRLDGFVFNPFYALVAFGLPLGLWFVSLFIKKKETRDV